MQKKFPRGVLALIVAFIGVMHALAAYFHLYFYVWWLDIPMHLIGGFWLGLSVLTYYFTYRKQAGNDPMWLVVLLAVSATFFVAVGWEAFEWSTDRLNGLIHFDLVDTLSDICNGMTGSLLGATVFVWRGYNKPT